MHFPSLILSNTYKLLPTVAKVFSHIFNVVIPLYHGGETKNVRHRNIFQQLSNLTTELDFNYSISSVGDGKKSLAFDDDITERPNFSSNCLRATFATLPPSLAIVTFCLKP